jgi:hypothetical protein
MRHFFYSSPETAHELTKLKKKHGFYFRTLQRTDNTDRVYCETTEPGFYFITSHGIPVEFVEDHPVTSSNWGGYREGGGRPSTDRKCSLNVRISQAASDKLSSVSNKSAFIDRLILEADI